MVDAIVPGLLGGLIVTVVAAWLSGRQQATEIETTQLLDAYRCLQQEIAFIGEEGDDPFAGLTDAEKIEMATRTGEVVAVLDLLGSRRVLAAIRSTANTHGDMGVLDISAVQAELRTHIRRRLGLTTRRLPRLLSIHSRRSLERQLEIHGRLDLPEVSLGSGTIPPRV